MPNKRKAGEPASPNAGSTVTIYERLFRINEALDAVGSNLGFLRQHLGLQADQVRHFAELIAEARAATNSYLLEVIAAQQTAEAGRLFGIRIARAQKEDMG